MNEQIKVLVVIPTYNEAENISDLINQIINISKTDLMSHISLNILVVDDDSKDGTRKIVKEIGEKESNVMIMERDKKYGLGTAYLAGFKYGCENEYDYVITMDADFSHNPFYIPEFLQKAPETDLVIGSRYVAGGGVRQWGIHRKALSFAANFLAQKLLGLKAHDATSGYRCYKKSLAEKLINKKIVSDGYSFLSEVIFWSEKWGSVIDEVPIIFVNRRKGSSKISHKEIFKAMLTLIRLFVARFRK